ncbi:MAG: hypothetical protein LCI00_00985 [Chloroflexi bacterium]|nr:hypothetical protein [Chloroflexota bacterium]
MDDLFKKLNVVVKATLNDVLTGDSRRSKLPGDNPNERISTADAEAQVVQLRKRIEETLAFEDELQRQIASLEAEAASFSDQADAAVSSGDDYTARRAVEQMQRVQERLNIARSDLAEHERVTQELIFHVNTLDAAVSNAKQNEATANPVSSLDAKLGTVLQDMRNKVAELRDQLTARTEVAAAANEVPTETEAEPETKTNAVDDDLAKRRQRLAKPE